MDKKKLLVLAGIDSRPDHYYEPSALSEGIAIEMEHTDNQDVAKVIAKTHIEENISYYKILKQAGL
jgi:hypothetical protein